MFFFFSKAAAWDCESTPHAKSSTMFFDFRRFASPVSPVTACGPMPQRTDLVCLLFFSCSFSRLFRVVILLGLNFLCYLFSFSSLVFSFRRSLAYFLSNFSINTFGSCFHSCLHICVSLFSFCIILPCWPRVCAML